MGVALLWVTFALAGVAADSPAERGQVQISYGVRMVDTEGVGWREAVFSRLKPVTRQGAATVWTLPQDAMSALLNEVTKNATGTITQAPRVTAFNGAHATIQCRGNRQLVTQASWTGGQQSPQAMPEDVRIGWHTTLVGRKLDQGILVKMVFEDTEIRAVHSVKFHREAAGEIAPSFKVNEAELIEADIAWFESGCKDRGVQKVALEVPEIGSQEVLGEWLIPNGEGLLVSFGAYTVADKNGKAVVKERLAIVEAGEACNSSAVHQAIPEPSATYGPPISIPRLSPPSVYVPPPAPVEPIASVPMAVPSVPSRSIPQGVHADGRPADLPPIPADETEEDKSASESAEPRPSPQTKKPHPPKPAADSAATKTAYAAAKSPTVFLPSLFLARPSVGFQFLLPLKPLSLRLPFSQRLEIEIYGRIVPEPQAP
jgi:hypothetical protein